MTFAIATAGTSPSVQAAKQVITDEHRKLIDAAQQFEGMLLQELLKPMKEHGFCQDEAEDDTGQKDAGTGFGDTLRSFGAETMATAIARAGGLGIAKRIVEQVEGAKASHQDGTQGPRLPAYPK